MRRINYGSSNQRSFKAEDASCHAYFNKGPIQIQTQRFSSLAGEKRERERERERERMFHRAAIDIMAF